MLGLTSGYGKSVQFEEMTGRENQFGFYVSDRWQVNEKLTVNLGLRYEYFPLMSRADRGLELLDYSTFMIKLGGLGGNPKDLGMEVDKALFAPRLGLAYRINEDTVFRTGFGRTFNPMPWSRPDPRVLSGDDRLQRCRSERLHRRMATWPMGFPARRIRTSRAATSRCRAASPCARPIRTISSGATRTRGTCSSSVAFRTISR